MRADSNRVGAAATWLISAGAVFALLAGFSSQLYESVDPKLALTLNPANTEAAVNAIVGALNGTDAVDLEGLRGGAAALVSEARGDARGYSLLGAVIERQGDVEKAEALYQLTLEKSKTEIHALLRLASLRLERGDYVGTLDCVDLILRRWGNYAAQIEPLIVAAARDAVAAPALTRKLNAMPPWRGQILSMLARNPQSLAYARDLIATAPDRVRAAPGWTGERDFMVSSLAAAKAFGEAYGLFLSTMSSAEREVQGYVFDGRFLRGPSRNYFGWRVQKSGSIDIAVPASGEGARIRFSDSPARPGMLAQTLALPLGSYRLEVQVSASALTTPKGLYWTVKCAGQPPLMQVTLAPGSYTDRTFDAEFEVPASGCDIQTLSLDTQVLTDSWRDRYSGEVLFQRIGLTRL
jgi:tetratricopeptide (TPR) repeat protein